MNWQITQRFGEAGAFESAHNWHTLNQESLAFMRLCASSRLMGRQSVDSLVVKLQMRGAC